MDKFISETLSQLLLISKIPREGKLSVKNGDLNIYRGGFINWTFRVINGDGKYSTVLFLKDLYTRIKKNMRELIKNNKHEYEPISKRVMSENLYFIIVNLYLSRDGIENLRATYRNYIKIKSELEFIDKHVIIPTIRFYLKSDEPKFKSDMMKKIWEDPKIIGKKSILSTPINISEKKKNTERNPFSLEEEAAEQLKLLSE